MGKTAIVTGASRGFGRAIAGELAADGTRVVGVARHREGLEQVAAELGDTFVAVVGDAADPELASRLIDAYQPQTIVLNAGTVPNPGPLSQQTWETFSANWHLDVQPVFNFAREAVNRPLAPGSTVISLSSGAALTGSALSGGYAGAKATIRFMSGYANAEAQRRSLGIRFRALLPKITPAGGVGAPFIAAYAAYDGITEDDYLGQLGPVLNAYDVAKGVALLAHDDTYSAPAYLLSAAGLQPLT